MLDIYDYGPLGEGVDSDNHVRISINYFIHICVFLFYYSYIVYNQKPIPGVVMNKYLNA